MRTTAALVEVRIVFLRVLISWALNCWRFRYSGIGNGLRIDLRNLRNGNSRLRGGAEKKVFYLIQYARDDASSVSWVAGVGGGAERRNSEGERDDEDDGCLGHTHVTFSFSVD